MQLKCEQVTAFEVDYSDWDDFINEFLRSKGWSSKWSYDIVSAEELGNYQTFRVYICDEINNGDLGKLMSNGDYSWKTRAIGSWACEEGLIKSGTYYISVFW